MSGGREARENVFSGKEEGASAHREDCAFTGRVLLLKLSEVIDEAKRFGVFLENFVRIAAENDENVKVFETFVCFFEGDLRADNGSLGGEDLGLSASEGHFESFGDCLYC